MPQANLYVTGNTLLVRANDLLPADRGSLVSAIAYLSPHGVYTTQTFGQISLLHAGTDQLDKAAILATGYININHPIGWLGRLPLQFEHAIFLQIWNSQTQRIRLYITTDVG